MKLYYFVDKVPEQRYSSSIHSLELIEQVVSRFGIKAKKYDRTVYKDEDFDIQLYSLSTNPEMIEAEFHLEKRSTIKAKTPLYIKNFMHSVLNFPLSTSLEKNSIMHYFDKPHYRTVKKNKIVLELGVIKETTAPEFFTNKTSLFESIKSIKEAALVVTHSHYMAEELSNKLFINPSKIRIIPRAFNNYTYEDKLTRYNLPEKFILFCGNIQKYKNLERLIRCFDKKLLPEELSLVIAGACYGEHSYYLKKLTKNFPPKRVVFTGYVNNKVLPSIMRKACALIEPSYVNDFPDTIVQAQLAGTAVIASHIPEHITVCKDSVLYFSPLSDSEMRTCIEKIHNKSSITNDLINKGKALSSQFTWDNVAPMYKDLYESLY